MPDLRPFTNVFRVDPGAPRVAKRTRHAVSCTTCQRRKTKCDRQQPCGACDRRGGAAMCVFGPGAGSNANTGGLTTPVAGRKEEAQLRLTRLEEIVRAEIEKRRKGGPAAMATSSATTTMMTTSAATAALVSPVDGDSGLLGPPPPSGGDEGGGGPDFGIGGGVQNGSLGTDANDSGYWTTFLEDLHGVQSYLDEEDMVLPDPSFLRLGGLPEDPSRDMFLTPAPTDVSSALQGILALLPPRDHCDSLLALYFGSKFTAPSFLHVHQFQRSYETFWEAPSIVNPLWLSMLFNILCTAHFVRAARAGALWPGVLDCPSKTYEECAARCLILGRYLDAGPYSVEAVTLFAYSRRSCWADSDTLGWWLFVLAVRLAQRRKYNRDAPGLTPFQTEMRRRLWAFVDMCEVLASAQAGLPSVISDDSEVPFPRHLTDDDFDEDTVEMPPDRPLTEPLTTSLVYWKSRLTPIGRQANRLALMVMPPPPEQTWATHAALESWRHDLPSFMKWRPIRSTAFSDQVHLILSRSVLEVTYRKYLCMLHRRCLTDGLADRASRRDARWAESRRICCESALITLDIHFELDRETMPGGRLDGERHLLSSLMLHDFLVAAMIICLDLNELPSATKAGGGGGGQDGGKDDHDQSRKLQALQTALSVWKVRKAMMPNSADAAHATRVLGAILRKVTSATQHSSGKSSPASDSHMTPSVPSPSSEAGGPPTGATSAATVDSSSSAFIDSSPQSAWSIPNTNASGSFFMFPSVLTPVRGTALLPPESTTEYPACEPDYVSDTPDWVEIDQFLQGSNSGEYGEWFGA